MRIEKELNKVGINPSSKITAAEKNILIEKIVTNLINTFPALDFSYSELAMRLYNCNMYKAKIDPKFNKTNYFYKNRSIYFDETLQIEKMDANMIHECIHYLQDVRKNGNQLYRIGLCEFNDYRVIGLGLNEMVLQYITEKMMSQNKEKIENTSVLDLYADILLKQIIFLFGEELMIKSAINADEKFEEKFMDTFQEEEMYYQMTATFDKILEGKQQIDSIVIQSSNENEAKENSTKIDSINHKIYHVFEKTQLDMFDKYFSTTIKYLDTIAETEECKQKIIEYKNLIECYEEEKGQYDKCVEKKLELLDKKVIEICKKNSKNTLIVFRNNPIINLLNNIRKVFFKNESY